MHRLVMAKGCLAFFLLAGCSTSTSGGVVADAIDAEGGTVEGPSGVVLSVPAGAVSESTEVEISQVGAASLPATLPGGLIAAGEATVLTPHGLSFAEAVQLTIPASSGATTVLRLDDESDSTWEPVSGATFEGGMATVEINSFSVYLAAGPDPDVPVARGVIDPPEAIGGGISTSATLDRETGWIYSGQARQNGLVQFRRARLGVNMTRELVFEGIGVRSIAVGPTYVYFYYEADNRIARLSHDLQTFEENWIPDAGAVEVRFAFSGVITSEHLYIQDGNSKIRASLEDGTISSFSFRRPIDARCALSPDRTLGACTNGLIDFVAGTETDELRVDGRPISNGPHAADDEAFYYTPQTFAGQMARIPYDTKVPTALGEVEPVVSATAVNGRLYLGSNSEDGRSGVIRAYEAQTGALVGSINTEFSPNAILHALGDTLYFGVNGGDVQTMPLSAFEP